MSEKEYDGPDGPQWEGVEEAELLLLLGRVAQEAERMANEQLDGVKLHFAAKFQAEVLERRLGPLLRAGCAMRTNIGRWGVAVESMVKSAELFPLSQRMEIVQPAVDRCNAALSAWNVARMDAMRALGEGDKK
jgi:hypothetical protein